MDKKRLFQREGDGGGPLGRLGLCSIGMAAPYAWIAWFLTGPTSASGAPFLVRSLYPGFVVACAAIILGVLARAFEIKTSEAKVPEGVANLKRLRDKLSLRPGACIRPPEFMAVITGVSQYAREVEEGIYVIPICGLRA